MGREIDRRERRGRYEDGDEHKLYTDTTHAEHVISIRHSARSAPQRLIDGLYLAFVRRQAHPDMCTYIH